MLTWQLGKYKVVEEHNNGKIGVDVSIFEGQKKLIGCFVSLKSGCVGGPFDDCELSECSEMSKEQIYDLYVLLQESVTNSTSSPTMNTFSAIQCYLVQCLDFDMDSEIVQNFEKLSCELFERWTNGFDLNNFQDSSFPPPFLKKRVCGKCKFPFFNIKF